MQLIIAIVQAEDADVLVDRLIERDYRVTRLNSVGSFLARGNATIFIGVEDDKVEEALVIIRSTCRTRRTFANPLPQGVEPPHISLAVTMPLEVEIGGAIVWTVPVKRFVRLKGGAVAPATGPQVEATTGPDKGEEQMDLVFAVIQNDDADSVTQALLSAGYRLTRLNTAGGFLRRGNATLLIGVEEEQVDAVLKLIEASCRQREQPAPSSSGMPMYSATIFVLDAARFVRM